MSRINLKKIEKVKQVDKVVNTERPSSGWVMSVWEIGLRRGQIPCRMAGVMARMIPAAFPLVEPGDTGALGEQMVYEAQRTCRR